MEPPSLKQNKYTKMQYIPNVHVKLLNEKN